MPKFHVTGPDGSTYEINAPQGASEADAVRYAQRQFGNGEKEAPKASAPAKRSPLQTAGDFVGDTIDNFLPNWGDEIAAIPDAAKAAVTGKPIGAAFTQGRKDFKSHQAQYDKEHGNLAWVSTLGGLGASLALPAGRVAEGASLVARVAHGAAVGAGYGAVSGAGEGSGIAARANNAATGAMAGGVMGGAVAPAISAASLAGRFAKSTIPGVAPASRALRNVPRAVMRRPLVTHQTDAQKAAGRLIQQRSREGDIATGFGQTGAPASPEAIVTEQRRRADMGVPAIPGDITDALRGLTGWASRGMGPGQTRVRQVLDARKEQEAARVRQHVIDTMGDVGDPIRQMEEHVQSAKDRAAPLYRKAYSQPMVVTPEIEAIMRRPSFQAALPQARTNILEQGRNPTELGFRLDRDGNIEASQTLTAEGYDQVIRAMRDHGQSAMNTDGIRPVDTTNSVGINNSARSLRDELGAQNQPYREAVANYGDDMTQRDAFEGGRDVMRRTGHEINEAARRMPDAAHPAWSAGARTALADEASRFGAQHSTGSTARRISAGLGDDTKQEAIGRLTGNTGGVRNLQDRLEAEHQGSLLWNDVQGNSKTAQRQQADRDTDGMLGNLNPSDIRPTRLAERLVNGMAAGVQERSRNAVKDEVARFVTERDPAVVEALYGSFLETERRRQARAALGDRTALHGAKVGAVNWEAPEPDVQELKGYDQNPDGSLYPVYGPPEDGVDAH